MLLGRTLVVDALSSKRRTASSPHCHKTKDCLHQLLERIRPAPVDCQVKAAKPACPRPRIAGQLSTTGRTTSRGVHTFWHRVQFGKALGRPAHMQTRPLNFVGTPYDTMLAPNIRTPPWAGAPCPAPTLGYRSEADNRQHEPTTLTTATTHLSS